MEKGVSKADLHSTYPPSICPVEIGHMREDAERQTRQKSSTTFSQSRNLPFFNLNMRKADPKQGVS